MSSKKEEFWVRPSNQKVYPNNKGGFLGPYKTLEEANEAGKAEFERRFQYAQERRKKGMPVMGDLPGYNLP